MATKLSDVGGQFVLDIAFSDQAKPASYTMQLITDNNAPADSDTVSTHIVATGGGYVDKTLSLDAVISVDGNGIPTATWSTQTWTFTGALTTNPTIYGYQVKSGTTLIWAGSLTNPFTPGDNGDQVLVTPTFKLGNGTPE